MTVYNKKTKMLDTNEKFSKQKQWKISIGIVLVINMLGGFYQFNY